MLIHSTCAAVSGRASSNRMAAMTTIASPPLVGSMKRTNFWMLSYTARPSRTALAMVAKLSSASTMSDASLAASVPFMPMATPTSARLRAGASFTPSPVMATTWPSSCRALTRRSLCSGLARANTSTSMATRRRAASSIMATSAPVMAGLPTPMPSWAPMARAVSTWSPVIILTRMPAWWHSPTARMASSRGGSMMPTSASSVKPDSMSASARLPLAGAARLQASASRRRPCAAVSVAMRRQKSTSIALSPWCSNWALHMSRMRSGAPLAKIHASPLLSRCQVAMKRCSDSNGIESSRGQACSPSACVNPVLPPSTSRAPSVGSPTTCHWPSSSFRRASLHSTPARTAMASAG